ncbi:MAG: hypothetical protein R6V27_04495 [Balneolaceae bacterium]
MPGPAVWMIRLSLCYLLFAVVTGAFILVHKAFPLHTAVWGVLPVHYEVAIWGWLVQFVMGTAYWIFPRFPGDSGRGPVWLAWGILTGINAGVWLLAASVFMNDIAIAGRTSILLSVLAFTGLMWNRVVSYRNRT